MSERSRTPAGVKLAVTNRPKTVIAALALVFMAVGLLAAFALSLQPAKYQATATIAMTPEDRSDPVSEAGLWEVLSRGQATRTSALVLGSTRFLPSDALKSGVVYEVGAVPETTLIEAKVTAGSPAEAEAVLKNALDAGLTTAQGISGPFALRVVTPVEGSAVRTSSSPKQLLIALGGGGLVAGAGLGFVLVRVFRTNDTSDSDEKSPEPEPVVEAPQVKTPAAKTEAAIPTPSP
ncbi:hypothetical protein [Smaragdicoccus niigatensis]|uniref:hypothetical protein n=1 Tax=Smaragdicoccus niigatensis TaxID=359359 RepID=UPI000360831E|nr:hypothetical protein [Smaragdicoccus niigatensis]